MKNERWRMGGVGGSGGRDGRFNPPYDVDDEDQDDYDESSPIEERKKMSVKQVWSMLTMSIGAFALTTAVIALGVMFGLNPLGISLSYREALVVSSCYLAVRFFDIAFGESLRKRSK